MTHQRFFTKSSSQWLSDTLKIEFFSTFFTILLIGIVTIPIITITRLWEINCQLDQETCSEELSQSLLANVNQPIFINKVINQILLNSSMSMFKIQKISIFLPKTLNLSLTTQRPVYLINNSQQLYAVYETGQTSVWSSIVVPDDLPIIDVLLPFGIQLDKKNLSPLEQEVHARLLPIVTFFKKNNLKYQKIEMIDINTIKIWLTQENWALIDLNQPDSIQSLTTIINHPNFLERNNNNFHLDMRFKYPLLLNTK